MTKKILVFADGTGNAFTTQESNVWRLFRAVDQSQPDQIAHYIQGVGTSGFRPFAMLDGATGFGVPSNVRKLYRFICWNWKPGDEIWLFGFSRGSFTVRALVGLIDHEGLVPARIGGEQVSRAEMDRNAMAAWRAYRSKTAPSRGMFPTVWLARKIRDLLLAGYRTVRGLQSYDAVRAETERQDRSDVAIAFLGVFDTVEAFGVPIEELRIAIDKAVWPISFRTGKLSTKVLTARHALAFDEERRSFFPIRFRPPAPDARQSIEEVWFAGVHSDIGGGYPDGALSFLPLVWMAEEAGQKNLRFRRGVLNGFRREASPFGRLHDSRSGLAALYRYAPRRIAPASSARTLTVVHRSVLEKMTLGSERYAPVPMPPDAVVLMPNGTKASLGPPDPAVHGQDMRQLSLGQVLPPFPQFKPDTRLPKPDPGFLKVVRAEVWWRRVAYFALLFFVIATAALPLTAEAITDLAKAGIIGLGRLFGQEALGRSIWDYIDGTNSGIAGSLGRISGTVGGLLPSYVGAWISVFVESFLISMAVLLGTFALYRLNSALRDAIADHVHCAWSADGGAPTGSRMVRFASWAQTSRPLAWLRRFFGRRVFPTIALGTTFAALAIGASHLTLNYRLGKGVLCAATADVRSVSEGDAIVAGEFSAASVCWPSGVLIEKGRSYTVWIDASDPFRDGDVAVGTAGFESSAWPYRLAGLIRRRWDAAWFQPLAQIGDVGGEAWPLTPADGTLPVDLDAEFDAEVAALCGDRAAKAGTPRAPAECRAVGGEERAALRATVLDARLPRRFTSTFTAQASGELFLYVNDALYTAPLLPLGTSFYADNRGKARVVIERSRVPPPPPAP